MKPYFCLLDHSGFLIVVVRKNEEWTSGLLLDAHPATSVSLLHELLKKSLEQGKYKTEESRTAALQRLAVFEDLIILLDVADQILISNDVQIAGRNYIMFTGREELITKLRQLKPRIPMLAFLKVKDFLGPVECFRLTVEDHFNVDGYLDQLKDQIHERNH